MPSTLIFDPLPRILIFPIQQFRQSGHVERKLLFVIRLDFRDLGLDLGQFCHVFDVVFDFEERDAGGADGWLGGVDDVGGEVGGFASVCRGAWS